VNSIAIFLNISGSTNNKRFNEKEDDVSPLQNLFKYFNQPFNDTPPQWK